jgi:hypothetical protein
MSSAAESPAAPQVGAPSLAVSEPSPWTGRAIAATTFLGAFLLFQVQPLIGNVVLPWFGGTPTVWTTSMLFFQAMLVVGYGFVYLTTQFLPPAVRSALYVVAAVACALTLPILPEAHWKPTPDADPTTGVLVLLFACVGAPYFLLSTTGPTTQEWFARAYGNRSPYRLYSLSNLGSLLGLLTYPFLVQPLIGLTMQSTLWSIGFATYAVLVVGCAWMVRRVPDLPPITAATPSVAAAPAVAVKKGRKPREAKTPANPKSALVEAFGWLALSAGGSALLLATTNHLCQDISSFPLLWVAPLVVYLLTFIICFDRPEWYRRIPMALATVCLVPIATIPSGELIAIDAFGPRYLPVAVLNLAMLFCGCMLCHGELAALKPEPRRLTFYFFMISVGGALGGLFVGYLAPMIYDIYWEWLLAAPALWLFASILLVDYWTKRGRLQQWWMKTALVVSVLGGLLVIARNHLAGSEQYVIASDRNFYGVLQVSGVFIGDTDNLEWASMRSGSTRHGTQIFKDFGKPNVSRLPTTYFGQDSGIGRLLLHVGSTREQRLRIGVVGLGVGTLATYAREGDTIRFYEINPIVIRFADEFFTYLKECPGKAEIVVGDARLQMEQELPQHYDILVLDAFSSDAIPTHLLTTEAFEIYLKHLEAHGVLAMHISNRYLNLAPVVAAAAKKFGLQGVIIHFIPGASKMPVGGVLQQTSRWVLMTRRPESPLWKDWNKRDGVKLEEFDQIAPWTDERSNFLEVLE